MKLTSYETPSKVQFDRPPGIIVKKEFNVSADRLLEHITNYSYRHNWVNGVDKFEYNPNEVTRLGTEHVCVIDGRRLNFTTITKNVEPDQLVGLWGTYNRRSDYRFTTSILYY